MGSNINGTILRPFFPQMCVKIKERVQDFKNLARHVAHKFFQLLINNGSLQICQAIKNTHNNKFFTNNNVYRNDEMQGISKEAMPSTLIHNTSSNYM